MLTILKPLGPGTWKLDRYLFTPEVHPKGKETAQLTSNRVSGRLLTALVGLLEPLLWTLRTQINEIWLTLVCNKC